jgi:2-phosphoglycerate kinase
MEKRIIITDKKHGLPFSKGLAATSFMATGITPKQAFHIAENVEISLRKSGKFTVTSEELNDIMLDAIKKHAGSERMERYLRWRALGKLDKPLIVMVGGTTGVGKSTIASEVAHRLGITRLVSTDSIREVMRSIFSKELTPALHESSFKAWEAIRTPLPDRVDPIIAGFMEQCQQVTVGIKAVIQRGINENTNMVMEGIHVVPGFIDFKEFNDAFIVPVILNVNEESAHQSHFYVRAMETKSERPYGRYKTNFATIRKIGYYIESLAKKQGIPIIQCYNLDVTVSNVIDEIYSQVYSIFPMKQIEKTK